MSEPEQENFEPQTMHQSIATFLVATLIFSLLYIHAKIVWLCLIPFAILGVVGLPKQESAKLFKQRLAIFAMALIASFVIGVSWVALN